MTEAFRAPTEAECSAMDPEALRVATVRAIRMLARHCADPKSRWHQVALEYMEPRKHQAARWLAANALPIVDSR